MREGVTYKRLGDVCGIQYGFAFDSKCFTSDDSYPPIIRIRDVVRGYSNTYYSGEINERYYVEKGDYLIGMDGEFNIATWQSDKALLNQRVCKIFSIDANTSIRYIYYALRKVLKQIEDETPFVTVKHLSASRLNKVSIALPPLSTQELIVRELDSISSVISAKKQQVLELDNLAQAIFLDTFGDPITNPKGWEVKKMSEIAEIGSGGTPSKQNLLYWENGDVPWIGSNMCQNSVIYQTDGKYITRDGLNNSSAKLLSKGTVLVALVGATIGKVALLETETSTNQNVAFIKPKDVCLPYYLYFHLMHLYDLFMNIGNGDFKMANLSFVRNLPVSLPPLSLQQAFAEKVQAIEEQKRLINQSIAEFESLLAQRMEFHFA